MSIKNTNSLLLKEIRDKDKEISKKYERIENLEKTKRSSEEHARKSVEKSKSDVEKMIRVESERFSIILKYIYSRIQEYKKEIDRRIEVEDFLRQKISKVNKKLTQANEDMDFER